jgi:hypothetical protein
LIRSSACLLQRESVMQQKAERQHAAALDVCSPLHGSPLLAKGSNAAHNSVPVRGVACMLSPAAFAYPNSSHVRMPSKGVTVGALSSKYALAPGVSAAYVL